LDDEMTFPHLARVFNEVKESYACARLLLFEAVDHPCDTRAYDGLTYQADNLDYAVCGVRPAKLKAAFTLAYSVLDKLAVFVGRYLTIENADRTDFDRLWHEDGDVSKLRCAICKTGNRLLYGLFDMSRDLDAQSGYFSQLRRFRNLLTHRYLVLHTESRGLWRTEIDGDKYHVSYRDFAESTVELLRLARAAIVNTMLYVASEQHAKHRGVGAYVGRVDVPPCGHYPLGPFGKT
jgi:hypothetical protein